MLSFFGLGMLIYYSNPNNSKLVYYYIVAYHCKNARKMIVNPRHEEVKFVGIKKTSRWGSVLQTRSSWEEAVPVKTTFINKEGIGGFSPCLCVMVGQVGTACLHKCHGKSDRTSSDSQRFIC